MIIELKFQTNNREELIDITSLIEKNVNIQDGILHIFVPHATCGVTINENADLNLPKDITAFLNQLVKKGIWLHDKIDGNADAHIKSSIIGNSVSIPICGGKLQLGRWQNIFLCEFDGPRERKVILTSLS